MILQRERTMRLEHWRPTSVMVLLVGDFALLGIVVGAQGVLWASLMAALRITKSAFGGALLTSPLMAVLLLLFGGHLSAMIGKKRMGALSLFLMGTASLILGAAGTVWAFLTALLVQGAGYGLFETAMNGAALDWERATGRRVLNLVHGSFNGGTVVGALGAGAMLAAGWRPPGVLAAVASLAAVMLFATLCVTYPRLGTQAITDIPGATLRLMIGSKPLRVLSLIGALGAVGESVIFLWSVIYLRERGASPMMGGLVFSLLSSSMMAGRLANVGIVRRYGPKASFQVSGVGLLCSSILLVVSRGIAPAILALGLMSVSVASVLPTVLTTGAAFAPKQTGAVAAGVLAAFYVGLMVTSPTVGVLADTFSLNVAFLVVGLSGLGISWLARKAT
jgi:MFS family permease